MSTPLGRRSKPGILSQQSGVNMLLIHTDDIQAIYDNQPLRQPIVAYPVPVDLCQDDQDSKEEKDGQ